MRSHTESQRRWVCLASVIGVLGFGCFCDAGFARDRVQPAFEVSLVYADGQAASGVSASVEQIILDGAGNRARCYPDAKTRHWWRDASLGLAKRNGPSDPDGRMALQGASVRKKDEQRLGIRDLASGEKAAYEIQWSGGMAAPETAVYPIDGFPRTITLRRGVRVMLVRQGPGPAVRPVVFPQAQAYRAAHPIGRPEIPIKRISDREWTCILKEDASYVIGCSDAQESTASRTSPEATGPAPRGYVCDPFVARAEETITFSPGLPGSIEADLSRVSHDSPIFPCTVELYRKTTNGQCRSDARIKPVNVKLTEPRSLAWHRVAHGAYYVRVYTAQNIYGTPQSFGEIHFPVELASGGTASVPIKVLRLDQEVLPTDISVTGCLEDSHDEPIAQRTVYLVPAFGDTQFGKVAYPAVKTQEDGRFEFHGVTPNGRYTIAYERLDGSFGVYPVHRGVLGVKDYVLGINDFSTNSAERALPLEQVVFESKNGQSLSVEDFKGKVVVVDFWASWCSPCIRDMPNFLSLAEKLKGHESIVFLAVSVDSERILWEQMLAENPWPEVKHGWFDPVANHRRFDLAIPYKVIYDGSGSIIEKGHDLDLAKILEERAAVKRDAR